VQHIAALTDFAYADWRRVVAIHLDGGFLLTRACLREIRRVLLPGGRGLVLEFSMPPGRLVGWLYRTYFTRVLPLVGRLVSRHEDAYSYLPRTVLAWPEPPALQREMEQEGFVECGFRRLSFGVACLHWGRAPGH